MAGVKAVEGRGVVNEKRIAVSGWSYGGADDLVDDRKLIQRCGGRRWRALRLRIWVQCSIR